MTFLLIVAGVALAGGTVAWVIWRKSILSIAVMIERVVAVGFFALSAIGCFAAGNDRGGLIATAIAIVINGFYMLATRKTLRANAGQTTDV
jgi:hypothetical protein